jgi:hypothetical protein
MGFNAIMNWNDLDAGRAPSRRTLRRGNRSGNGFARENVSHRGVEFRGSTPLAARSFKHSGSSLT